MRVSVFLGEDEALRMSFRHIFCVVALAIGCCVQAHRTGEGSVVMSTAHATPKGDNLSGGHHDRVHKCVHDLIEPHKKKTIRSAQRHAGQEGEW